MTMSLAERAAVTETAVRHSQMRPCVHHTKFPKMGARAWAAARVSDDPQMQLWTPAPGTVTWPACCGVRQHDLKDQALLQHHSHGQIHQYFHHTFGRLFSAWPYNGQMYGENTGESAAGNGAAGSRDL